MESRREGFFERLSEIFNLSIYNPKELIKNSALYGIIRIFISLGMKAILILSTLKLYGFGIRNLFDKYFMSEMIGNGFDINGNLGFNVPLFNNIDINNSPWENIILNNGIFSSIIRNILINGYNSKGLFSRLGLNLVFLFLILIVLGVINSLIDSTNTKILVENNKKNNITYIDANRFVFSRKVKLIAFDFIFKYLVDFLFAGIGIFLFIQMVTTNNILIIIFLPIILLGKLIQIIYRNYISFLKVNLIINDNKIIDSINKSNRKIKEMKVYEFIKKLFFIVFVSIGINIGLSSVFSKINVTLVNWIIEIVVAIATSAYFILISSNSINSNLDYIEVRGKE